MTPSVVEKGSQVNRFLPVLVEMYHFVLPEGLGSPLGTVSVLGRGADALPGTMMIITVAGAVPQGCCMGEGRGGDEGDTLQAWDPGIQVLPQKCVWISNLSNDRLFKITLILMILVERL